jgi:hypothetical protein
MTRPHSKCPSCGSYEKANLHHTAPHIKCKRRGIENEKIAFCRRCHKWLHKRNTNKELANMTRNEQVWAARIATFGDGDWPRAKEVD